MDTLPEDIQNKIYKMAHQLKPMEVIYVILCISIMVMCFIYISIIYIIIYIIIEIKMKVISNFYLKK